MMKTMIVICLTALIIVIGCSKSEDSVNIVKNGNLDIDKSMTIGQAFEKYQYFSKTNWKKLETDKGSRVVQVSSELDLKKLGANRKTDMKRAEIVFHFLITQNRSFILSWCGIRGENMKGEKIESSNEADLKLCGNSLAAVYRNSPDI